MLGAAKYRAKRRGIPFRLAESDIKVPDRCPVLGLKLEMSYGRAADNSPSLDRLVPEKGYVKGNVVVVSNRANSIRGDATVKELRRVYLWYRRRLKRKVE
jgi:hypothetical protein